MNDASIKPQAYYTANAIYQWVVDNGWTPYIMATAKHPELKVPPETIKDGHVVLNVSPSAISQLSITHAGWSFFARFGGASKRVHIPLTAILAVYAMENGQGVHFPDHDRIEHTEPAAPATEPTTAPSDDTPPTPPRGRPSLSIVK